MREVNERQSSGAAGQLTLRAGSPGPLSATVRTRSHARGRGGRRCSRAGPPPPGAPSARRPTRGAAPRSAGKLRASARRRLRGAGRARGTRAGRPASPNSAAPRRSPEGLCCPLPGSARAAGGRYRSSGRERGREGQARAEPSDLPQENVSCMKAAAGPWAHTTQGSSAGQNADSRWCLHGASVTSASFLLQDTAAALPL